MKKKHLPELGAIAESGRSRVFGFDLVCFIGEV
jgi:hypothetical protein